MNLDEYRTFFAVGGLILILVASVPSLSLVVPFPGGGERFSELWFLGPGRMAEGYPFNVRADEGCLVYVGVGNHLGSSAYYVVYVKLRNQSEPLPDVMAGTPSQLPPLYEWRVFLEDGNGWEAPLEFSFSGVSCFENRSLVESITINGVAFSVDKLALWDGENNGYYYELFVELWIYDADSDAFQFHNRFVGIWLNMTAM